MSERGMLTEDKSMDEARQGEALITESTGGKKKVYIETYGCQMNFNDSEIVASILSDNNYDTTDNYKEADLVFLNTCSIRDKAEQTVRKRLSQLKEVKRLNKEVKVGVMGCMAERLKSKLLEEEQLVDIVVGPDAYRKLPELIDETETGQKAVNVILSKEETYEEIKPVRLGSNGVTAFISIMRGCDNMCSFCVVPFTRGRERSRDAFSVVAEAQDMYDKGYKEVTLLGQNVDSYKWENPETKEVVSFARLMEMVAHVAPDLRIRFSTSHPKDMTDDVLHMMAKYDNICNYIHLPLQSGNSRILKKMNRTYDREWYKDRIDAIRRIIPGCAISSDIIAGFCSETEEEHQDTLSMMEYVKYDLNYMFFYSERPGTLAARKYEDDIPEDVKKRRLQEIVDLQMEHCLERNKECIGKTYEVLIEGPSKRSPEQLFGRTDANKVVIFDRKELAKDTKGMFVKVKVKDCTSVTLFGEMV